jgi:uncharacterized protein YycO
MVGCLASVGARAEDVPDDPAAALRTGDIVFQTSQSPASLAIQIATHSPYSHVGIVWVHDGRADVIEAIEPVRITPFAAWRERGVGGHFVAERLRNAGNVLTPERAARLVATARAEIGKHYDLAFAWNDARMYCSELVWKAYHRALGVDLGTPRAMRTFDLDNPLVQSALRQRWSGKLPLDELMIAPSQIFESDALERVDER